MLPDMPGRIPAASRLLAMLLAAALLVAVTACENTFARGEGDSDGVEDAEVGITF